MAVTCPVCGYRFNTCDSHAHCAGCPMNSGCNMICCPNCQYEWLESSGWVGKFVNFIKKRSGRGSS